MLIYNDYLVVTWNLLAGIELWRSLLFRLCGRHTEAETR